MKLRIKLGGIAVMLSACVLVSGCPLLGAVVVPDDALESAIRASLQKPFGLLTENDLLSVQEIQGAGLNIRDLSGLENCRNLQILNLRSNRIQSITPLTNLVNLSVLDLGDNAITNIGPVAGLFNLTSLDLFGDNNDIRDFSPLVANAQAGGLGSGDTVTLGAEWTLNSDGSVASSFQSDYNALLNAGVRVLFAETDGSEVALK